LGNYDRKNHQIDKNSEASTEKKPSQRRVKSKKMEYLGAVIGNLVLFYIVNHLMEWHIPFITEDFYKVLPYMNWSIGASIVANILYIFFDQKFIHLGTMPVLNILSLLSVFMLFKVFPFDFKLVGLEILNQVGKILLGLAVLGVIIGIAVDWYKLIRNY